MGDALLVADLGVVPYGTALEFQRDVARRRISGEIADDVLLLVQHPHVITLGRASKEAHLVASRESLAARGVELFEVERGGDVTYHGPGQLVGYPIIDLKQHRKDLHWYLRQVEEAIIQSIAHWGLTGWRSPGFTGVWVGADRPSEGQSVSSKLRTVPAVPISGGAEMTHPSVEATTASNLTADGQQTGYVEHPRADRRKLASIGVHARDWVTWHGFALNVATDLTHFDAMIPCGIQDVQMTSISAEVSREVFVADVADAVAEAFGRVFELTPVSATLPTG